jgi:hypothetical protein
VRLTRGVGPRQPIVHRYGRFRKPGPIHIRPDPGTHCRQCDVRLYRDSEGESDGPAPQSTGKAAASGSRGGCRAKGSVRSGSLNTGMPQNFIGCDREQAFLLPPSLREWLPEDHLAWFVLDTVARRPCPRGGLCRKNRVTREQARQKRYSCGALARAVGLPSNTEDIGCRR